MPAGKQDGITLTFSKKNTDIYKLIQEKKDEAEKVGSKFIATDYFCEAARFFEKHKNNVAFKNNIDLSIVENLVDKKIAQLKEELLEKGIQLTEPEENAMTQMKDLSHLEDDLDEIPIDDD